MPQRLIERFQAIPARWFLVGLILIQFLLHLPVFNLPPMGQHTWRQAMGLATARNYFEEGNAFWYPTQDVRISADDDGRAYFELPLLYWVIGQSYHLTGFHHANGRLVQFAAAALLLVGAYSFSLGLGFTEQRTKWFVLFISLSPYFFYYSVTISPNLPALAWFLCGLGLLLPQLHRERFGWKYWTGAALMSLGALSKASFLFFGLPVAWLFLAQYLKTKNPRLFLPALGAGALIVGPSLWVFGHARRIYEKAPYARQYYIELGPKPFPETLEALITPLRVGFVEWFPQMYVNLALVPFFISGVWLFLRYQGYRSERGIFFLLWVVSFLLLASLFVVQLREHAYYQNPLLIVAAMGSAFGFEWLLKNKGQRVRHVALLLVGFAAIIMIGRVEQRWIDSRQVPVELIERSDEFRAIIPKEDRVLVYGDSSPVIYLYYLARKGVVVFDANIRAQVLQYREQGARWLVSDRSLGSDERLADLLEQTAKIGDFVIYRLPTP